MVENNAGEVALKNCIENVRIAVENHEQNPQVVIDLLQTLIATEQLSPERIALITRLQKDIKNSDYQQSPQDKYENPLARRFESECAIQLLVNPTTAMLDAVGQVSAQLIQYLDHLTEEELKTIECDIFCEEYHAISFGAFKKEPTLDNIKGILQANDKVQLAEIIHIHYKLAQFVSREYPIRHHGEANKVTVVGEFAHIINEFYSKRKDPTAAFFTRLALDNLGNKLRYHISDDKLYDSPLYTAGDNRGRGKNADMLRTCQTGLMLRGQEKFEEGFFKHASSWVADCKSQSVNLESQYVIDLIDNDAVYVSGPSGMTSNFLNQMEIIANLDNEDLKKNYLAAFASYIVAGGFHSWHEVLGPAQYALNLVPGYQVTVIEPGKLAPPPNYHQFFAQQAAIDHEFSDRLDEAWTNYLRFFKTIYQPQYLPIEHHLELPQQVQPNREEISPVEPQQEKYEMSDTLKKDLLAEIDKYIRARGNDKGKVHFFWKVMHNTKAAEEKLSEVISLKKMVGLGDIDSIKDFVVQKKALLNNTQQASEKISYNRLLSQLDTIIEQAKGAQYQPNFTHF